MTKNIECENCKTQYPPANGYTISECPECGRIHYCWKVSRATGCCRECGLGLREAHILHAARQACTAAALLEDAMPEPGARQLALGLIQDARLGLEAALELLEEAGFPKAQSHLQTFEEEP
jgi:hypothetical protein